MQVVQDLSRTLAAQLATHRDHPRVSPSTRKLLNEARTAVLAIPSAPDPHTAAARALAAVERTRLNWLDGPPFGGRGLYAEQMDALLEATAPAQPHDFVKVPLPVLFFPVDLDTYVWKAAVQVEGQWYTRHCAPPERAQELGATARGAGLVRAPFAWQEADEFSPEGDDTVKTVPVEFPLFVQRPGREWDGWRAWIPAPRQINREGAERSAAHAR